MEKLIRAFQIVCEAFGADFSKEAIKKMLSVLNQYPHSQVFLAFDRVLKEHQGRLTLAAIISRIETGHPGPEEAYSIAKSSIESEESTVVWTKQIQTAAGVAMGLDKVAGRMAFIETYKKQDFSQPPHWYVSLGWDKSQREGPILEAARLGRITHAAAQNQLPESEQIKLLVNSKEVVV